MKKELQKARIYWRKGDPIVPIVGEASAANFRKMVASGDQADCWPWTGARDRYGYGMFKLGAHLRMGAHRIAYALGNGEPGALHVLHRCDNPTCCNPGHLFPGDPASNAQDKVLKGRAKGRFSPGGSVSGSEPCLTEPLSDCKCWSGREDSNLRPLPPEGGSPRLTPWNTARPGLLGGSYPSVCSRSVHGIRQFRVQSGLWSAVLARGSTNV